MSRPVGLPKTGGRPPGGKNKATLAREAAVQEAKVALSKEMPPELIEMLTPKDLLLFVMRRAFAEGHMELAMNAARKVAPYCHARGLGDLTGDELEVLATLAGGDQADGAHAR